MASEPPVRLAIAGVGLIGKRHIDAIDAVPEAILVACAEPAQAARSCLADRSVPCCDSLTEVLCSYRPDGVIVATPSPLHEEQGLACIAAGCPVLVEKPLATSVRAAERLVTAAKCSGVPLLVGHHRRHSALIRKARAIIDAGTLGAVRTVQGTCWFYKPDHYFSEASWRRRAGAGPVSVNLVHDVDVLRYLCGEPLRVQARTVASRRGHANEDAAVVLLELRGGALATLSVADAVVSPWSWEMTAGECGLYPFTGESALLIGGSRAALSIPDLRLWQHPGARDWWQPISATMLPRPLSDPLVEQLKHFVDVVRGGENVLVPGEEGLRTLRVIDAIECAARSGDSVDLSVVLEP